MSRQPVHRVAARSWLSALMGIILALSALQGMALPASGQAPTIRADAIVIVNSTSANSQDFSHFIQPYLDHFGVPYTTLDIASAPLPADLGSYALIVIGHSQLDMGGSYLSLAEQAQISAAVNQGTGLVNFDNALADAGYAARYQYVQDIFGFGYGAASASAAVAIHSNPAVGNYIVAAQPTNAAYTLNGSITPLGVTIPAQAATLATVGARPLLVATSAGQGRAVQWTSYEWMHADIWGYVRGFDDLIWRSLVWAARKPFVMQGLPPFVTMRVDDASGPYSWVDTANLYGLKPWAGLFLDDQSAADALDIKRLVDAGGMTVAVHARTTSDFFYFDHDAGASFSDQVVTQNFADATAWHTQNQIPISKYVVPHFYEAGTNVFQRLRNWGVEFIGTMIPPGNRYYDGSRLMAGPFNRYEATCSFCTEPLYYADFLSIPGHAELDGLFFVVNTEIRDNAGYEWYPDSDVAGTIDRGVTQLKRALDGMELATLFTHEYYFSNISASDWDSILAGVTQGITSYQPEYVTMDYAAQYIRAMATSNIASSIYDPNADQLITTLTGSTDLPTRFYLFTERGGAIQNRFVNVPVFSGSTVVLTDRPTAVTLASFTAKNRPGDSPLVEWETAMELRNLGFNLYRTDSPTEMSGPEQKLNDGLIPSESPGSLIGASYAYVDETAAPGGTYYYWLEAIDYTGIAELYGPVSTADTTSTPLDSMTNPATKTYLPLVFGSGNTPSTFASEAPDLADVVTAINEFEAR